MKKAAPSFTAVTLLAMAVAAAAFPVSLDDPVNRDTVSTTIPSGWSLIANPVNHFQGDVVRNARLDNSLAAVLPTMPEGTHIRKFDRGTGHYHNARFQRGRWTRPDLTLNPTDGAIIYNPTKRPLTIIFQGDVSFYLWLAIPKGESLVSFPAVNFDPLPSPNTWPPPGYWVADRSFNPQPGDRVGTIDRVTGRFVWHRFRAVRGWDRKPQVGIAESFYVITEHPRTIRILLIPL